MKGLLLYVFFFFFGSKKVPPCMYREKNLQVTRIYRLTEIAVCSVHRRLQNQSLYIEDRITHNNKFRGFKGL